MLTDDREITEKRGSLTAWLGVWSREVRTDRATQVVTVVVVYTLIYVAWTFAHFGGDPTTVTDIAPIPLSIVSVWLIWRAARNRTLDSRTRRAWLFIGLGIAAWGVGDLVWCFLELVQGTTPFPSVADAGYLSYYPLVFAGLVLMPVPRRPGDRITLWLDTATVMIGTVMSVWYLVIGPTLASAGQDWVYETLSLAYPVGDLILVLGVARILLRRPASGTARSLLVLGVALLATAVADTMYARLSLSGSYSAGSVPDALWALGLTLAGVAAYLQVRLGSIRDDANESASARPTVSRLPYVAVGLGFVLLLRESGIQRSEPLLVLSLGALAISVIVVIRQLTVMRENERLVDALDVAASTDSLTGLYNRRRFHELASRLMLRAAVNGEPVAAVMIDIDKFKQVNDQHGHAAGDAVLQWVATRCSDSLRAGDLVSRFGGDEFVVLLPGINGEAAAKVAARLGAAVADVPISTGSGDVTARLSLGVADNGEGGDLDHLLSRADAALYEAKRAGRGRTVLAGVAPPVEVVPERVPGEERRAVVATHPT